MNFILKFFVPFLLIAVIYSCEANISANSQMKVSSKTLLEQVTERKIPKKDLKIYIQKAKRTLSVQYKAETLISYPCVLGFAPEGDKMKEGDGKTPEGNFGIKSMYPHKSWSFFIWFDYPNAESQKRFKARKASGEISKNSRIGGDVGIHGVPTGYDSAIDDKNDWTLGCISLKTAHITDLYNSISTETKIEIVK
ncbi:MAG: murein L,D-transpeptidase family protein [Flavobacteriia bacterium]|jgi:murein L,D-transpeptidase YafK